MASTLTNLLYHIVFSTKNREPIITAPIRPNLYKYMGGIIRSEGGTLLEIGGIADHVHLVAIQNGAIGRNDDQDRQIQVIEVAELPTQVSWPF
jgi:putative transposase